MRLEPRDALLAFFTMDGVGAALQESGLTITETLAILADIARNGKTDQGKLAAIKMIFERAEFTLRLERLLSTDTTRTLTLDRPGADPIRLTMTEIAQDELADSVAATERDLRRALAAPACDSAPMTAMTVIDVEPVEPEPEEEPDRDDDTPLTRDGHE